MVLSSTTANSYDDRFTCGGRTVRPTSLRQSYNMPTTLSVWSMSADSTAAMYDAASCVFSQPVWYDNNAYAAECDLLKP